MKLNQFFFLKNFCINDSNIKKKEINLYNSNKIYFYHNWWFIINSFNFYKKLNVYKPFLNKTNYSINYVFFKKNKTNFIFNDYVFVELCFF